MAGIGFGTNYDAKAGNGLGPVTTIISIVGEDVASQVSQAELDAFINGVTVSGEDKDAFTIAGISGLVANANTVYVALQGSGTVLETEDAYADGVTATIVATFAD